MDSALRELVRERAGGFCEYCQMPEEFTLLPFQIDHIIAEKHQGANCGGEFGVELRALQFSQRSKYF